MINKVKKNYIDNNRYLFIIASVLFGLCYVYEVPHGDDINASYIENASIKTILDACIKSFKNTYASSIVGSFTAFLTNTPRVYFIVSMMITMYILFESLRSLFSKGSKHEKDLNTFIVFAAVTYSFIDMQSAGWIVTTCCYFVPAVFFVTSLIPIKKVLKNETFKTYEYIIYTFAMLFSGNQPQGMAVQLVSYSAIIIYCIFNKKNNKYIYLCFAITIMNLYFTFTSNWHLSRIAGDVIKRMPTINMYNFINKLDIGLSSSFGWLFFGSNLFLIFTLIVFTFLIFIRYKNKLIRFLSIIPEILCFVSKNSFINNMSINAFEISPIDLGTSNYGLFNLESINNISTYLLYFSMSIILIIIIVEIFLLTDNINDFIQIIVLLSAGFGSRLALAFTPNIFASAQRTFVYLNFTVILTCVYVYTININYINKNCVNFITRILSVCFILPLGYFFVYVYNYRGKSLLETLRKLIS